MSTGVALGVGAGVAVREPLPSGPAAAVLVGAGTASSPPDSEQLLSTSIVDTATAVAPSAAIVLVLRPTSFPLATTLVRCRRTASTTGTGRPRS
ncbi:hypothetical protein NS184_07945 [Curtobacterium luteum]|uniref:Uncharacterized protein n=1 Tax=Curtobacterium luteum TaxID=33881 RepID=A0A175RUK5_9MICO|nr:hypothetical protein NS184_07945 [Curtobacterium luteum]